MSVLSYLYFFIHEKKFPVDLELYDQIKRRPLLFWVSITSNGIFYINRMELWRRARPTNRWERARFVFLWTYGMSLRAIARHTGSSVTTVYRWIRRWQQEGHVDTRPRLYRSFECDPLDYTFLLGHKDEDLSTTPVAVTRWHLQAQHSRIALAEHQ